MRTINEKRIKRLTYAKLTVETKDDTHVDEITEECGGVDVVNEESLLKLTVEIDDWFDETGTSER